MDQKPHNYLINPNGQIHSRLSHDKGEVHAQLQDLIDNPPPFVQQFESPSGKVVLDLKTTPHPKLNVMFDLNIIIGDLIFNCHSPYNIIGSLRAAYLAEKMIELEIPIDHLLLRRINYLGTEWHNLPQEKLHSQVKEQIAVVIAHILATNTNDLSPNSPIIREINRYRSELVGHNIPVNLEEVASLLRTLSGEPLYNIILDLFPELNSFPLSESMQQLVRIHPNLAYKSKYAAEWVISGLYPQINQDSVGMN